MKNAIRMILLIALTATAAQAGTYSDHVLGRPDVIAYYQLNEGVSPAPLVVNDSTGTTANKGKSIPNVARHIVGPGAAEGWSGLDADNTSYDFKGGRLELSDAVQTALNRPVLSVAFFFKDDQPAKWQRIIDLGLGQQGSNELVLGNYNYKGNVFMVHSDQGKGYRGTVFNSAGILDDGEWHHVVVTRAGRTGYDQIKVYVDGAELPMKDSGLGGVGGSTGKATIGARSGGTQQLDGGLDEVAFFSTALSAPDVADLYKAAATVK